MKKFYLLFAFNLIALFTFGQAGNALDFDGSGDYVTIPNAAGENNFSSGLKFTVEFWCKVNTTGTTVFVNKGGGGGLEQYSFDVYGSTLRYYVQSAGGSFVEISATQIMPAEGWVHLAGTFDAAAGEMKLYKNGAQIGSTTPPASLKSNTNSLALGRQASGGPSLNGELDEVRIWDIALSACQIASLYDKTFSNPTAPASCLKSYYRMSNGSGTSLTDDSGNGNTGTLQGNTSWVASGAGVNSQTAPTCSPYTTAIYVNVNAIGNNDGSSWTDAFTDLQDAIDNQCGGLDIWVAAGTYLPTDAPDGTTSTGATDRNNAFHLATDMKIYGGFNGTETQLSQRDVAANTTILSGDFNDDDVVTGGGSTLSITNNTENAYHVMITANLTVAAVIDGFTFSGGNANVASGSVTYVSKVFYRNSCGGMTNSFSSPTIINATFMNNNSLLYGGGMYNHNSSPMITNSTFMDNKSSQYGGGMYSYNSSLTITNSTFVSNSSYFGGGGMYNEQSSFLTITNSTFISNNSSYGGGMYSYNSSPTITNSTFVSNNANSGGGMYNEQSSSPTITNNIFWNNTKNGFDNVLGADIENFSNPFDFPPMNMNSIPTVTYCLTQANSVYSSGTGIINNQPPLFVDAANGDFSLQIGSPCIGMGDGTIGNSANTTTLDLAGNARFNGVIDMGAYESEFAALPVELLYFYAEKAENGTQLSWETATEINNDYFEVQWSTDGIDFKSIGQVQGAGTITEIQSYEFLHTPDLTGFGNLSGLYDHYYRLKQVDFDGKFEYSNIVIVNYQLLTVDYPLNIYPNPVRYSLTIENGQGTAIIYNALGQLIQQVDIDASKVQLDVSELPQGIYTIHIRKTNGENVTKQFVK